MLVAQVMTPAAQWAGEAAATLPPFSAPEIGTAFRVVDLVGVFANAAVGSAIARAERLDPIGFATLAILSGVGGGMIRDTLLQQGPPLALVDPAYLITALTAATITYLMPVPLRAGRWAWPLIDVLALGSWAASGALRTLAFGLGWLPAILLGAITAVGGGVMRDLMLRRAPIVLGGGTPFATCAAIAAGVMVLCVHAGAPQLGLGVATAGGACLALIARRFGWVLPAADAWSPAQVVPRKARTVLRSRGADLRRRTAQMRRRLRRRGHGDDLPG